MASSTQILHVPCPAGLSKRHPCLSPKATTSHGCSQQSFHRARKDTSSITTPREVVNNVIANKLFGPFFFFQYSVGIWPSGSSSPHGRAGSLPREPVLPQRCFSTASLGRQSVGQKVSLDKRPVQPPVPGNASARLEEVQSTGNRGISVPYYWRRRKIHSIHLNGDLSSPLVLPRWLL